MDADQAQRRIAQEQFKIVDPDYYEFEANIFFDDVMETDEKGNWCLNKFVKLFLSTLDEAARYSNFKIEQSVVINQAILPHLR